MPILKFSESFLEAELLERASKVSIPQPSIILNSGHKACHIGDAVIESRASSIFSQGSLDAEDSIVIMRSPCGFSAKEPYPKREVIMNTWTQVHDIFPLPHLQKTNLWRSEKQKIGNTAYNFWFAAAATDCGIHNEHDFLEIHTQIWGTGHMQKFREKNSVTLYEDILMIPGFTHTPFCSESDYTYPWHRYYADTECIWLATEYYS